MIQTVLPGECKILFCYNFSPPVLALGDNELSSGPERNPPPDTDSIGDLRTKRKKILSEVSKEVQSQYAFQSSVSGRSYEEDLQKITNEGSVPNVELGYLRLKHCLSSDCDTIALSETEEEKIVLWMATLNCGFSLLMDPCENRMNAESVLKLLIRHLHSRCQVLTQPNEIGNRADLIGIVLEQFIPAGTLLFMNHRVVRQFEKELEVKFKNLQQ